MQRCLLLLTYLGVLAPCLAAQVTPTPAPNFPGSPVAIDSDACVVAGAAAADSLVRVYIDQNNNDAIDSGTDTVAGTQQLTGASPNFAITVTLTQDADNNFLVTAEEAGSSESAPADVPMITEDSTPPATPVVTSPVMVISTGNGSFAISGTAEAGSLVLVWRVNNTDGVVGPYENLTDEQQLTPGETDFSVMVYVSCGSYRFMLSCTDAAGHESGVVYVRYDYTGGCPGGAPGGEDCSTGTRSSCLSLVLLLAIAGTVGAAYMLRRYWPPTW